MTEPVIVPRAEHPISRRDIDADALKVLYRLHESGYEAYLVGGSVRDLMLGRRPKDFDIGTSATPTRSKSSSGTAGSSAAGSAWPTSASAPRPSRSRRFERTCRPARRRNRPHANPWGATARSRAARPLETTPSPDPARQHVRHARRGCLSARLHHQRAVLNIADYSIIDYVGGLRISRTA